MKICTVVGARPQFIKAAVVSRELALRNTCQEVILHTGQHYDANMSDQFFFELDIPQPGYHLNIGSSSHGKQTGLMLAQIEEVLMVEKPDWVLVYGDTNSTLAGALAAVKLHIPVAHVEAGLRSFNRKMPEEINRVTTDHISSCLLAPTKTSYQRLLQEGLPPEQIFNVGDVMFDAALYYNERNQQRQTVVDTYKLQKGYVLATIHRAENTDSIERLHNIFDALIALSKERQIVLPLHPRTKNIADKLSLLNSLKTQLTLIDPVGYLDMLALEEQASLIITDSGGVQKEAYFNKVPCITLRDETEWTELVEAGWNQLCSPDKPFSLIELLHQSKHKDRAVEMDLYGKGNAAQKIVTILAQQ